MLHNLRVISLGNIPRSIRRLGLGTMTILSRIWVVEIARRVSICFQLLPLRQLVFRPSRTGMTRRLEHQAISLREVFQEPRLTPLALSVLGSVSGTKTYPTCPKCGKNHPGECLAIKGRMFWVWSVWSQVEGLPFYTRSRRW